VAGAPASEAPATSPSATPSSVSLNRVACTPPPAAALTVVPQDGFGRADELAVLAGGKTIVFAGATTQVWDGVTGEKRAAWPNPGGRGEFVVIRPDGGAAAGTVKGDLWVRDLTTGVLERVAGPPGEIRRLAWTADSRWLVIGGRQDSHFIGPGAERRTIPAGLAGGSALSGDGARMLDVQGRVWDTPSGRALAKAPPASMTSGSDAALSHDGRWLASAVPHRVQIHDVASGAPGASFPCDARVSEVHFSPDDARLVVNGARLGLWDVATGRAIPLRPGASGLVFSRDGTLLAYRTDEDRMERPHVVVAVAATGRVVRDVTLGENVEPRILAIADDDRSFAMMTSNEVDLVDVASGQSRTVAYDGAGTPGQAAGETIDDVAWSPDGSALALLSVRKSDRATMSAARVWDLREGTFRGAIDAAGPDVPEPSRGDWRFTEAAWSPDGQIIALARSHAIVLWDGLSAAPSRTIDTGPQPGNGEQAMAFGRDGMLATSRGDASAVRLWDARSGALLRTIDLGDAEPFALAFSRDGTQLAVGTRPHVTNASNTHGLRLVDPRTGAVVKAIDSASGAGPAREIHWAPRGLAVVTRGTNDGVELWSTTTGLPPQALPSEVAAGTHSALSPDGDTLVTGGESLRIADLRTATVVRDLPGAGLDIQAIRYSPDGQRLAIARGHAVDLYRFADDTTLHLLLRETHGAAVAGVTFTDGGLFAGDPAAFPLLRFREAGSVASPLKTAAQERDRLRPDLGMQFVNGCPLASAP
jgi:WD40 repeat protein